MVELRESNGRTARRRGLGWSLLLLLASVGCGDGGDASSPADEATVPDVPRFEMNGYMVPERQIPDPTLVDSCLLLTEADPKGVLAEPLAPIDRMSNVCLAFTASSQTLERSLTVELRHPEPIEIENGGVPKDKETFWTAEGGGVDLMGGKKEAVQEIPGLGDFSVWYPMTGGMALHTYWQGKYILAINVRGIDAERGLAWAKEVAGRAIQKTAELEKQG
jgi:hypothetical protein